jgi:hypothetical protein
MYALRLIKRTKRSTAYVSKRRMHAWAFLSLFFLVCGSLSTGYMYYQRNLYRDNGRALAAFTNELYKHTIEMEDELNWCRSSGRRSL